MIELSLLQRLMIHAAIVIHQILVKICATDDQKESNKIILNNNLPFHHFQYEDTSMVFEDVMRFEL